MTLYIKPSESDIYFSNFYKMLPKIDISFFDIYHSAVKNKNMNLDFLKSTIQTIQNKDKISEIVEGLEDYMKIYRAMYKPEAANFPQLHKEKLEVLSYLKLLLLAEERK